MIDFPWLTVVTFAPLVGALVILITPGEDDAMAPKVLALWTTLFTFVVSLFLWINFDTQSGAFQFVEKLVWMPSFDIAYHLGVDGISMFFILLSTLLTLLCVIASWVSINTRVKEYMVAFLVLETLMIGMFSALDLILFYVFFEGVLIPMFLIIGVWGGPRRNYAAYKFFLFTLTGSVLMLLAILTMLFEAGTASIPKLIADHHFSAGLQPWLWLAFFASFAVKVPMWPVHTWLPDAHVEAPTAGSVILAGVLLKFGGYGFLRFSLPMFPLATADFAPFVFALSIIAIIYTSLVALAQEDMKKLIAYSSVAHMGFVTIGIFALNLQAVEGAVVQMISHGIVSAALFLCVGVVYDRMHSRLIATYGGLVERMPVYAAVFMIFMLASIGLPGTSGFISEFLVMLGLFQVSTWAAALVALGMILGAAYMLWMYRRVVFGKLTKEDLKEILDLNWREKAIFAPLILVVLWIGIYPTSFFEVIEPSIENLIANYQLALEAAQGPTLAAR